MTLIFEIGQPSSLCLFWVQVVQEAKQLKIVLSDVLELIPSVKPSRMTNSSDDAHVLLRAKSDAPTPGFLLELVFECLY